MGKIVLHPRFAAAAHGIVLRARSEAMQELDRATAALETRAITPGLVMLIDVAEALHRLKSVLPRLDLRDPESVLVLQRLQTCLHRIIKAMALVEAAHQRPDEQR